MYSRPYESTLRFLERKFAKRPELVAANKAAFQAGWNFGETTEDFAVRYEVKPAKMQPGHLPQHHRQRGAGARPGRRRRALRAAGLPRRLPDHPGLGHPARAEQAQAVRRHHDAGRGRDRRDRRGARRLVRRRARRHHHLRPRRGAQGRDDLAGRRARAAAGHRRRAAGRPVHRHADQDRAGRPQHGAVRPARRGAGRGDRAAVAVRLLLRRDRGGPDRADLPHAGASCSPTTTWPTAPSRGCCPTSTTLPDLRVEFATEPNGEDGTRSCPTCATRRRMARPWAIPGTPGLEHRIGGLEKADKTGDISYDPANHDFMVRTRAARIEAIPVPDVEVEDPDGDRPRAGAGLGFDVRPDRRRLPGAAPARPADRPGAPAAPEPAAGQPRRGARARTTRWSSRR